MGETKNIQVVITELVKKKLASNGKRTITVKNIARDAATKMGLIEKGVHLDKDVYLNAERILQELGGILWSKQKGTMSKFHVYGFNIEKPVEKPQGEERISHTRADEKGHRGEVGRGVVHEKSSAVPMRNLEKAPAETETTAVRATKLAMMLAIELNECHNSDDPTGFYLGKTLIESLAAIYSLEVKG